MNTPTMQTTAASTTPRSTASQRRSGGLARLAGFDVTATTVGLRAARYRVLTLPSNITDKKSFFAGARAILPLIPAVPKDAWDALDDSLFEGLLELPEDRVAVMWSGARGMAEQDPDAFAMALKVLENVALSLINGEYTMGPPKSVLVVVDA